MRKEIITCDKCGKVVTTPNKAFVRLGEFEEYYTDLCDECCSKFHDILLKTGFVFMKRV